MIRVSPGWELSNRLTGSRDVAVAMATYMRLRYGRKLIQNRYKRGQFRLVWHKRISSREDYRIGDWNRKTTVLSQLPCGTWTAAQESAAGGSSENTVGSAVVGRWPIAAAVAFVSWIGSRRKVRYCGRNSRWSMATIARPTIGACVHRRGRCLETRAGTHPAPIFWERITCKGGQCRVENSYVLSLPQVRRESRLTSDISAARCSHHFAL
jgi:hypothetical protein